MKTLILFILLLSAENIFSQHSNADAPAFISPAMVAVEGGSFKMGSTVTLKNESPEHTVTINSFYIGQYEVTQSLWQAVMGYNPASFKGCGECPVEQVSWKQVQTFLSNLNKLTGKHYRLPTEAEWEYAAAGGNKSMGYKYSGSNNLDEVAWYKPNAENKTHPAGQKKPNELGLYDMSGNVWELCSDWYSPAYYKKSPAVNPANDKKSLHRVVRGGSWRSGEERCYSKARNRNIRDHHISNGGFRLVLDK